MCKIFKKTSDYLQNYCLEQLWHLSETRQTKEHLHRGNYADVYYRKQQKFLNRKADVKSNFQIEIQELNEHQIKSAIDNSLLHVGELVDNIESTIFGKMQ